MAYLEQIPAVSLVIRPQLGSVPFAVTLRAIRSDKAEECFMESSPETWHNFARRLEEAGLLGAGELGRADAHIGRGEPVQCLVTCDIEVLQKIGLREAAPSGAARVRGSFVARIRRFWVRQSRSDGASLRAVHRGNT